MPSKYPKVGLNLPICLQINFSKRLNLISVWGGCQWLWPLIGNLCQSRFVAYSTEGVICVAWSVTRSCCLCPFITAHMPSPTSVPDLVLAILPNHWGSFPMVSPPYRPSKWSLSLSSPLPFSLSSPLLLPTFLPPPSFPLSPPPLQTERIPAVLKACLPQWASQRGCLKLMCLCELLGGS